jgi:hypothetical protein
MAGYGRLEPIAPRVKRDSLVQFAPAEVAAGHACRVD